MKQIIAIIAIFAAFATAKAESPVEEYKELYGATFESLNINHKWLSTATAGSVVINKTDATITLDLEAPMDCAPPLACPAVMMDVLNVELQIVNQYTNGCGSIVYEAQKDQTPVDGLLQNIQVIDHQYMICEIALTHLTSVTYSTYNPWTNVTVVSSFGADALVPMPSTF